MTIRSMTGYGQAAADLADARVTVELRTVNHRYADVRLRLPNALASREGDVRRRILSRVKRGRIEVAVGVEPLGGGELRPQLNEALLAEVLAAASRLRDDLDLDRGPDLETLLRIPGMFRATTADSVWDDDAMEALDRALDAALDALDQERLREGRHLQTEMSRRLVKMKELAGDIERDAATQPTLARERLLERLKSLASEVELDPGRLAQEAALLADRSDVTEEIVRLAGHLEQVTRLLDEPDGKPLGKRLDFLLQELNRETNTINSKSSSLELSRHALALKGEIEKLREQVQNLE